MSGARLAGLARLAAAVRERRLADLARANEARRAAAAALTALPPAPSLAEDPDAGPEMAAARARWLLEARRDRNLRLAASEVEVERARHAATLALGRAEVLRRLADRGDRR